MLKWLRLLILGLWLGWLAGPEGLAASVVLVSSNRSAAYSESAEALMGELERRGLPRSEMLQTVVGESPLAGTPTPRLFIALGSEAASLLAKSEPGAPVLCVLLPRASFERILQASGRKASAQFSALYLDQPLSRQLDLVQLALPTARRIGVLWGPESEFQAPALKQLAQSRGLELVGASVGRDEPLFPVLKKVLEEVDVLLAVPDPQVYNSSSIQNILLATFRAKVPMVAFSPAYARAGALLALQATPSQIGLQAASLARAVLQGGSLPATPPYPQDFTVVVNEHVAHSLGLTLDPDVLRSRLRRREGPP